MFAEGMNVERQGSSRGGRQVFPEGQDKKDGRNSGLLNSVSQAPFKASTCVNPGNFLGWSTGTLLILRWGN